MPAVNRARRGPVQRDGLFFFQIVKFSYFSTETPLAERFLVWVVGLGLGAVVKGCAEINQ